MYGLGHSHVLLLHHRNLTVLRSIFSISNAPFWIEISDMIPGICWRHFSEASLRVTIPSGSSITGITLVFTFHIFSIPLSASSISPTSHIPFFFSHPSHLLHLLLVLVSDFNLLPQYLFDWPILACLFRWENSLGSSIIP